MEAEIKVSVFCVTYNQEKYIEDAIEGFLKQKTDFQYEIIIHDDCSTDNTTNIIREYEKRYPNKIKAIYEKENVYKESPYLILVSMYKIFRGKYIAFCEGDDYWIDPEKLQKQYNILESQSQCSICVGKNYVIEKKEIIGYMPDKQIKLNTGIVSNEMAIEMFFGTIPLYFQTASYFIKKEVMDELYKLILKKDSWIYWLSGDRAILKLAWTMGKIFYINDVLAVYRSNVEGGACDIVKKASKQKRAEILAQPIYSNYLFDRWTLFKYHNLVQKAIIQDGISLANWDAHAAKKILQECNIKYKDCFVNAISWKNFIRYGLIMNIPGVVNKM